MLKKLLLLLLSLTLSLTLYGAHDSVASAKIRFKRDVADEIAAAIRHKTPPSPPAKIQPRYAKHVLIAGRQSERTEALIKHHNNHTQTDFLRQRENEDIRHYCRKALPITLNRLQKIACQIAVRSLTSPRRIFKGQTYRIANPQHELMGPLGNILERIDQVNKNLKKC